MSYTVVSFHAHPDDEALLTAGTLARAAAEGHRVVIVVATAGEQGLVSRDLAGDIPLGERRMRELRAAAAALGAARVECLGYADSGMAGPSAPPSPGQRHAPGTATPFADCDVDAAARRLAAILVDEAAEVLTTYDPRGGYGHPDHVQVHRVGARAAAIAGTPVLLEATVDRSLLLRAARLVHWIPGIPPDFHPARLASAYSPPGELTHRVDVRTVIWKKREAMAAHLSQATADGTTRTLQVFLRLPRPVFRRAFGYEWFIQRDVVDRLGAGRPVTLCGDIFAALRPS